MGGRMYVGGLKRAGVLARRAATRSDTPPRARAAPPGVAPGAAAGAPPGAGGAAALLVSPAVSPVACRRGGGEGEAVPRVPSIHLSLQPTRSRKASGFLRAYGWRLG